LEFFCNFVAVIDCEEKERNDKRNLYCLVAHYEQCVYDVRLIWTSAPATVGHFQQLAAVSGDCFLVDDRFLRVLLPGASQPHWIRG